MDLRHRRRDPANVPRAGWIESPWTSSTPPTGYDLTGSLGAVQAPTLVMVGREDWITPVSSAQTIAQLLPNAELVIFEESGHSPQTEEREKFNRVVREFVDRVVPASATSPKTK